MRRACAASCRFPVGGAERAGYRRVMSANLEAGVHVRHKSRPEWGMGLIASVKQGDGHTEVVVTFEHAGEKKFRVSQDVFEQVPAEEVEAAQADSRRKAISICRAFSARRGHPVGSAR